MASKLSIFAIYKKCPDIRAVDQMVEQLRDEIGGKDFEELSALLGREGQRLTGAIFEEVIKSRGANESSRDTHVGEDCGRTLKRQKPLPTKTVRPSASNTIGKGRRHYSPKCPLSGRARSSSV